LESALELYKVTASLADLPKAQKLTSSRRSKLKARLIDCGGLGGWSVAMQSLTDSDFCRGKNKDGWKADLDFVLQEKSFTRLMEGSYANRAPQAAKTAQQNTMNNIRSIMEDDERARRETENHTHAAGLLADSRGIQG